MARGDCGQNRFGSDNGFPDVGTVRWQFPVGLSARPLAQVTCLECPHASTAKQRVPKQQRKAGLACPNTFLIVNFMDELGVVPVHTLVVAVESDCCNTPANLSVNVPSSFLRDC